MAEKEPETDSRWAPRIEFGIKETVELDPAAVRSGPFLAAFIFLPMVMGLNQLRYHLRKMKAHGLIRRDGHHYIYRLTEKGIKVSLLFLLFHKRLRGPLANHHRPHSTLRPKLPLEAAYHKADAAIQEIILLEAA